MDSGRHGHHINLKQLHTIERVSFEWPENTRFPGLDLIRLICLNTCALFTISDGLFFSKLNSAFDNINSSLDKSNETNIMLTLKVFCNMFSIKDSINIIFEAKEKVLENVKNLAVLSKNKNLHVALVTLYLNFAVSLIKKNTSDDNFGFDLLEAIIDLLKNTEDSDCLLRGFVCIGTLLTQNESLIESAKLMNFKTFLNLPRIHGDSKLSPVINHLNSLLK